MKYYFEALFSAQYFPFWEVSCFFFLIYNISLSVRLNRIENKLDKNAKMTFYFKEILEELLDEYSH